MLTSIAQMAFTIIAGSALSGFGLSFGRDEYRKTKVNWPLLVLLVLFVGIFFSSLWKFRNYRTASGAIFKKFGALMLLVISLAGAYLLIGLVASILGAMFGIELVIYAFQMSMYSIVGIQIILFLSGAIVGISHRRKRRLAWEAEIHNERFLTEHGLQIVSSDEHYRIKDIQDNLNYRFVEDLGLTGLLEFMLIGHRNKRAYVEYDETGKFISWSGLTSLETTGAM